VLKARPGKASTESPLVRVRQHRRRQTMLSYAREDPMTDEYCTTAHSTNLHIVIAVVAEH